MVHIPKQFLVSYNRSHLADEEEYLNFTKAVNYFQNMEASSQWL